ncbi:MAG: hypothetical protein A2144_01440 [Chloroflexi bacterium RBG_16_50_9]|nr:MAG: hypothetical protein A2144_01440 [Chloroflexi bacterium RBG_16_50_9]
MRFAEIIKWGTKQSIYRPRWKNYWRESVVPGLLQDWHTMNSALLVKKAITAPALVCNERIWYRPVAR